MYRPDYSRKAFASKDQGCQWVDVFLDWNNHRHNGIKFVTPYQQHSGSAIDVCRQRAEVNENACRANPTRWSRRTRCW